MNFDKCIKSRSHLWSISVTPKVSPSASLLSITPLTCSPGNHNLLSNTRISFFL